ncbi:hypothetical protein GCM10012319_60040 [Comamonas sp. KCTC 72670]|nr:hypothetical protein GCM10012319_60040 [Comamonas sp. KCTC 72670]
MPGPPPCDPGVSSMVLGAMEGGPGGRFGPPVPTRGGRVPLGVPLPGAAVGVSVLGAVKSGVAGAGEVPGVDVEGDDVLPVPGAGLLPVPTEPGVSCAPATPAASTSATVTP